MQLVSDADAEEIKAHEREQGFVLHTSTLFFPRVTPPSLAEPLDESGYLRSATLALEVVLGALSSKQLVFHSWDPSKWAEVVSCLLCSLLIPLVRQDPQKSRT